ncbi:hypothetical protein HDV63DRAFT_383185 [Trichoderma sp. SZMC 28014]
MTCSSLLGSMSTQLFSCWPCTPSPSFVIHEGVALIPTPGSHYRHSAAPLALIPASTSSRYYGQSDTATKSYYYHSYYWYYYTLPCSA